LHTAVSRRADVDDICRCLPRTIAVECGTRFAQRHGMDEDSEDASRRKVVAAALSSDEFTPASALVRAEFGARSHRGRVQEENDDHYLVLRLVERADTLMTSLASVDLPSPFDEHAYAAVVADGIGAAGAGSVAARLALSTLAHLAVRFG